MFIQSIDTCSRKEAHRPLGLPRHAPPCNNVRVLEVHGDMLHARARQITTGMGSCYQSFMRTHGGYH